MSYSLMIIQLLILKVLNFIKNVIKAFESLKVHILIMIFHAFLAVKKFLIFKYKLFFNVYSKNNATIIVIFNLFNTIDKCNIY